MNGWAVTHEPGPDLDLHLLRWYLSSYPFRKTVLVFVRATPLRSLPLCAIWRSPFFIVWGLPKFPLPGVPWPIILSRLLLSSVRKGASNNSQTLLATLVCLDGLGNKAQGG